MPVPLLHMTTQDEWEQASAEGELQPDSLAEQGFVHLSTPEQVHLPANRLYAGRTDVLLLVLHPERLGAEVRWEPGVPDDPSSMVFPHLYGPLPAAAVVGTLVYVPGADGTYPTPTGLPEL